MKEKLAELIFNNCKINKDIDEIFLKTVIEIVIDEWEIKNYSGDFIIKRLDKKIASYNCYKKIITLNKDFIYDINETYFPNNYNLCSKYLLILQALFHELIHAMQYNIQEPFCDDLEKLIIFSANKHAIEICNEESFTKLKAKYFMNLAKKYYRYSPNEKMAEIDSAQIIKSISEILSDKTVIDFMKLNIYYNYFRGYKLNNGKIIAPTPFYLSKTKNNEYIKLIKNLSIFESEYNKLRLGLDVDINSFLEIGEDLKKIYKKVNKRDLGV